MSEEIRIYVADLAAYNTGYLHGVWIDATLELDDIQAQVDAIISFAEQNRNRFAGEPTGAQIYEQFVNYQIELAERQEN